VNGHHISDEDLVLYSIQSLSAGETAAAALHVEECPECARQLAEVTGDLALLSLSADQQPVPVGVRDRIMTRIAAEPQTVVATTPATPPVVAPQKTEPAPARVIHEVKPRRNWFPILVPWAAAFAMLALAGYLGNQDQHLNELLNNDKGEIAKLSASATHAEEVLETLTSPAAKQVTLTEGKGAPPPTGRASYLADKGELVFIGNNLKPLPAGKTYEMWIIPADGKAPVPAGLFRPDDHGSASVVLPTLPQGVPAKAFGVTIENAAGSATPTMPIVLSGAAGL
jgi:anti-sigma factor RsiW